MEWAFEYWDKSKCIVCFKYTWVDAPQWTRTSLASVGITYAMLLWDRSNAKTQETKNLVMAVYSTTQVPIPSHNQTRGRLTPKLS